MLIKRLNWLLFLILGYVIIYIFSANITFNPSISETRGYYFVYSCHNYSRGDIVQICLEDTKYLKVLSELKLPFENKACPAKMDYLLKQVVATSGDLIEVAQSGIFINGVLQKNSKLINSYNGIALYPLQNRRFRLKKNEFFVLGNTPHSFDSRYFGVIKQQQITAKAVLILAKTSQIW